MNARKKKPKVELRPPFAVQQPKPEPTLFETVYSYLTYPFTALYSIDRKTLIGVGLLGLVGGGYAAEVANNVCHNAPKGNGNNKKLPPSKDKSILKNKIQTQACTATVMKTNNKPNIRMGMSQGRMISMSCFEMSMPDCLKDIEEIQNFKEDSHKTDSLREKVMVNYSAWKGNIKKRIQDIQDTHTDIQKDIFQKILFTIGKLKIYYFDSKEALLENGGNCGEHTSVALISLLQHKLNYKLEMKIQTVEMKNSLDNNDHAYLLLDADVNDIYIERDARKVREILDGISTGKICDPWNLGYYADLKTDNSGLYKGNTGWDKLVIKTYSLDFADFNKLSGEAQRFICNQLTLMGLHVEPEETCKMFKDKEQEQKVDDVKPQRVMK